MRVYKLSDHHLQERVNWLNDHRIYQHMNMQFPITLDETKKWYERVFFNPTRIDFAFEEEGIIVSMAGLTNIDAVNGLAEFYIMVNPDMHGKGFGQKVTEFSINYAFCNYNIHKLYLYTNHFNDRANRLYTKLGFQLEGTLRKHKFKNGQLIDRGVYGLLKDDWKEQSYFNTRILLDY